MILRRPLTRDVSSKQKVTLRAASWCSCHRRRSRAELAEGIKITVSVVIKVAVQLSGRVHRYDDCIMNPQQAPTRPLHKPLEPYIFECFITL
jgi:hypothetical protein